jgi:hypothetical protein
MTPQPLEAPLPEALTDLHAMISSGRLTHTTLVDGSGVVLDTDSLKVYALNETGAVVFAALAEGVTDSDAVVDRIVAAFDVGRDTAAADLAAYLADLRALVGGS